MSTRPFTPPDAPLTSAAPPEVSPALRKGSGTQSIGNRLRFVWAFSVCLLGAWLMPWIGWQLLVASADAPTVVWVGSGLEVCLLVGVVWIGLTFAQDLAQFAAMRRLWATQLTALGAYWATLRDSQAHYARRWYQPPPDPAPPRIVKGDQHTVDLAARAQLEHLQGQFEAALARLSPQTAPVPSPCRTEATTQTLPESGPVAAAYFGGPMHRIVASALRGEAITVRALTPTYMSRPQYDAARAQLLGAGVLVAGERGGVRLTPVLAGLGEDAAHTAVVRMLAGQGRGQG